MAAESESDSGQPLKQEPLSPQSVKSEGSRSCTSPGVYPPENGHNSSHNSNGGAADDSSNDMPPSSHPAEAPLDFSMKPKRKLIEEHEKDLKNASFYQQQHQRVEQRNLNRSLLSKVTPTSQSSHSRHVNGVVMTPPPVGTNGTHGGGQGDSTPVRLKYEREERIGEPQIAIPGSHGALPAAMMAGMPLAGMSPATAGLFANFPFAMDPRAAAMAAQQHHHQQQLPSPGIGAGGRDSRENSEAGNNANKTQSRPFKAYPKDPLTLPLGYYGIPGMVPGPAPQVDTATAQAMSMSTEELFNHYRMYVLKAQEELRAVGGTASPQKRNSNTGKGQAPHNNQNNNNACPQIASDACSSTSTSSNSSTTSVPASGKPPTTGGANPGAAHPSPAPASTPTANRRKRGSTLPDELKDEAYWERRRKNNDAAKRSRDARRAKEDEIAIRAAFLEQENLKLRVEVAALKNETAKLRCMLYNS